MYIYNITLFKEDRFTPAIYTVYIHIQGNNSKNTGIKTRLKALQTVSPIKGIIRGILF